MSKRNKINDAAAAVAMTVVVIAAFVTWQSEQLWPAAAVQAAVVVDDEAVDLVAERFPTEDEQFKPYRPEPVIEVRTWPQYNGPDGFERTLLAINHEQDAPKLHLASLPPVVVDPPKSEAPKPEVWNPPLGERKVIAEDYVKSTCPTLMKFNGKQSPAEEARIDRRFMRAKSPTGVRGVVLSEIRSSTFASLIFGWCPNLAPKS